MEKTPLQIYQRAYNLHYKEENMQGACELYKTLIKSFPESDVAGYAAIQLSKIQSQAISDRLPDGQASSRDGGSFLTYLMILATLCIIGWLIGSHFITMKQNAYMNKLIMVLSNMQTGNETQALVVLNSLKLEKRHEVTPYILAADIYRKQREYAKARKEFELYNQLYPNNPLTSIYLDNIMVEEEAYRKELKNVKKTTGQKSGDTSSLGGVSQNSDQKKIKLINAEDVTYF